MWLVGVRPGTLLLGLGPGSRDLGRVRAADCPACLSGTRWLTSYLGTVQPSCRLPAGRVCSGRAYRPPGLEHSRGSGVAALPPGPRCRPRPCCLPRLRWWSLVRYSGVLSSCHPARLSRLKSVLCLPLCLSPWVMDVCLINVLLETAATAFLVSCASLVCCVYLLCQPAVVAVAACFGWGLGTLTLVML